MKLIINNIEHEYPNGITYREISEEYAGNFSRRIVEVRINNHYVELSRKADECGTLEFVTDETTEGAATIKRSTLLLMIKALENLYGNDAVSGLFVQFAIDKGLFCNIRTMEKLPDDFCIRMKSEMRRLADLALPIEKHAVKVREAEQYYTEKKLPLKARLFDYRRSSYVSLYRLDGLVDYFYGCMVPDTSYIKTFDLYAFSDGFVLQLPSRHTADILKTFDPPEKLFATMKSSSDFSQGLGISAVSDLNDFIVNGRLEDMILAHEALQEQKIGNIAERIAADRKIKFCMIAGPSSSGKTTFSRRLSIQLTAHGLNPHPISLDNYYVNREATPLDEKGNKNYECLEALDVKRFNQDMLKLLAGESVEMPEYNFIAGKREYKGNFMKLGAGDVLVIEGIHGLNDALSYALPRENKFKIYISALTQLNIDEHNRIPTTDGRLLRRIIRDARTRGKSAQDTIAMWDSVRHGEEQYIFPYQEDADVMFNSALIYEFAALKTYAEPVLYAVPRTSEEYPEAKRLLRFLDYFLAVPDDEIPKNSLVREFIGGGCFDI